MKSFLKYTLATILGLFLFSFLGILLLVGIGAAAGSGAKVDVKENSVDRKSVW